MLHCLHGGCEIIGACLKQLLQQWMVTVSVTRYSLLCSLDIATAICAPTCALFSTSAMFASSEAPSVNSLTRSKRNGVTDAPFMPWLSASCSA
jgi:hypothetical protein